MMIQPASFRSPFERVVASGKSMTVSACVQRNARCVAGEVANADDSGWAVATTGVNAVASMCWCNVG